MLQLAKVAFAHGFTVVFINDTPFRLLLLFNTLGRIFTQVKGSVVFLTFFPLASLTLLVGTLGTVVT